MFRFPSVLSSLDVIQSSQSPVLLLYVALFVVSILFSSTFRLLTFTGGAEAEGRYLIHIWSLYGFPLVTVSLRLTSGFVSPAPNWYTLNV